MTSSGIQNPPQEEDMDGILWTKSMKASSPWGCAGVALAPDPGSKVGPPGRGHIVP